jgi:sodium pump decarboxylase gamma subunit
MDATSGELLVQGLWITVIGMGLVFAALALLWAMIEILRRLAPAPAAVEPSGPAALAPTAAEDAALVAARTAERARVAAIVAGALMSSAVPLHLEPPVGPVFEHGRTAPIWVTANRSHTLQPWQPPRPPDQ